MDNSKNLQSKVQLINEKIIKTDELLKLVSLNKQEFCVLNKKYKKIVTNFFHQRREVNILNIRLTECKEKQLFWEKENLELKSQNDLLEKRYNEYVTHAENKYQTACAEIVTLNKTCYSLNKEIKKYETKQAKAKTCKKLQDNLEQAKKQLQISNSKYNELVNNNNETISNLKQQYETLKEQQNESLNHLDLVNADLKNSKLALNNCKNSPTRNNVEEKIKSLEEKLKLSKIEFKNEIGKLTTKFEKEKEFLVEQLTEERINKNLIEDEVEKLNHKLEEKIEILNKTSNENNLDCQNNKDEFIKKYEDENKLLRDELEKLRNKIREENEIQAIFKEMCPIPTVLSPLNPVIENEVLNKPTTHSVAVGSDDIMSILTNSYSQTCTFLTKTLNPDHNKHDSDLQEITNSELVNIDFTELCEILTNDQQSKTVPLYLKESCTQTCDVLNDTKSILKEMITCSVGVNTDFNEALIDTYTQTCEILNKNTILEEKNTISVGVNTDFIPVFTKFSPQINDCKISTSDSELRAEKLKSTLLKSRITKKYKINNKHSLLNTLRNSTFNVKKLLESLDTNSKFVIISPSIFKSSFNKTDSNLLNENLQYSNNTSYTRNYQNVMSPQNCYCYPYPNYVPNNCGCFNLYPGYNNGPPHCHCNNFYRNENNCKRSCEHSNNDSNLRVILKEYKKMLIKTYRKKYLSKFTNKYLLRNEFRHQLSKKRKWAEIKNKHRRHKRIIYSSESECDSSDDSDHVNTVAKETQNQNQNTNCINNLFNIELTANVVKDNEQLIIPEEIEKMTNKNSYCEKINDNKNTINDNQERILSEDVDKTMDYNMTHKNVCKTSTPNDFKFRKPVNTLSKKQQLLIRKIKVPQTTNSLKLTHIASSLPRKQINVLKRKSKVDDEVNYKKQKIYLFGSDSDENDDIESNDKDCVEEKTKKQNSISNIPTKEINSEKFTVSINENQYLDVAKILPVSDTSKLILNKRIFKLPNTVPVNRINSQVTGNEEKFNQILSKKITNKNNKTTIIKKNALQNQSENLLNQNLNPIVNKEFEIPTTNKQAEENCLVLPENKLNSIASTSQAEIFEHVTYNTLERCYPTQESKNNIEKTSAESNSIASTSQAEIFEHVTYNTLERCYPTQESKNNIEKTSAESNSIASTSQTEICKRGTYNTLEKSNPSQDSENNIEMTSIELEIGNRLLENVITGDWNNKGLMTAAVKFLIAKDVNLVARIIVNRAAEDFSQELDKTFTPPAPLLTVTQQKILVLLDYLKKNHLNDIYPVFLQTVETKLISTTRVEVVYPLTRLYVAVCKLNLDIQKVRVLCCNAAFYKGDLLFPLMFIVLTMWAEVLPMASNCDDNPLIISLVQVIHSKKCNTPGYNYKNLIRLLDSYFGYKLGDHTSEEILNKLILSYSETYSKSAYTAILMLCKSLPNNLTHKHIKTHMLPLLDNGKNQEYKTMTLSLIQRLISSFKKENKVLFYEINDSVSKHVI